MLLFSIRDDRAHTITYCWVSAGEDNSIDERNNDNPQANPGEKVSRIRLSWLHEPPQWKTNCEHAKNWQNQVFQQRKLVPVVFPVVERQRHIRDQVDQRYRDRAQSGDIPKEGNGVHSPAKA